MILAGDVGGTKTVLGLFRAEGPRLELVRSDTFRSADHPSLGSVVSAFLQAGAAGSVEAACFGVAGPVIGGRIKATNLTWEVDGQEVSAQSGIPRIELVNDLLATASGIAELQPHELWTLQDGSDAGEPGNAALVAPGTGLGMAILFRSGRELLPSASEGGHMDFAPRDEEEIALLRTLQQRFGRVSVERILSGPGLVNVYEHLRDTGFAPELPSIREQMRTSDPAGVVGTAGVQGTCPLSVKALGMFCTILGATAGNLALVAVASGGVYLGGGIPPKILPRLKDGAFLKAFLTKGRLSPMLEAFSVQVILNDRTGLLGAARRAARLAER